MKRSITALGFCVSLLLLLSFFLFPPVKAKEDVLLTLLNLPAPPPPNPLVSGVYRERDQGFYDKKNPPKDDASIEDLLEYWRQQGNTYQDLRYSPEPTDAVHDRILREISKDPQLLAKYLRMLEKDPKDAELVKEIYDRESAGGDLSKEDLQAIRSWLTRNSPYYSNELARLASNVSDADDYVTNQADLLALVKVDFDKARPMIDRINGDSSLKTSRVLVKWALYRHALLTDSIGDIEQYRDELKAFVEDKTALPGMRDLAMDALVTEKEWSGRDDWYYSLLSDDTLADLRVNGQTYTGLTTLILVSPPEKYADKMIELLNSSNPILRGAAIRNLAAQLTDAGPEIIKAMLPWLDDPKWAFDAGDSRLAIVQKLSEYEIPESVPGLIKMLNEGQSQSASDGRIANTSTNSMGRAANVMTSAANTPAGTMPANAATIASGQRFVSYPYRSAAINALAKQKDGRAVPALRHILQEVEGYERSTVVGAILACGGFSVLEQLDALDTYARHERSGADNANAPNPFYYGANALRGPLTAVEIREILGQQLTQSTEISDELARAIVDRIETLDTKEPAARRHLPPHDP